MGDYVCSVYIKGGENEVKGYKYLVPIGLVFLMAFSIFTVIKNAGDKQNEYETYLSEARKLSELDVIEDALKNYQSALEIKNTVDVNLEVGQMYVDHEWYSYATSWGEYMVDEFPKEPKAYTFLLKCYITQEDYENCFALKDQAVGRNACEDEFDEYMDQIMYVYELGYDYYDDVGIYSNGYWPVESEEKWGYANYKGEKKIGTKFLWAGAFNSDLIAPVQSEDKEFYYISTSGNKKIAVQNLKKCTDLSIIVSDTLAASNDGEYGYYDTEFNAVIDATYDYASAINLGVGAVKTGGKWKLIDAEGKQIGSTDYDDVILDDKSIAYRNERAFVKSDDDVIMVDSEGKKIGDQTFQDAKLFLQDDAYTAVKIDGKWGFVDKNGKVVIEPQYDDARSFSNGYAAVKTGGKWGFIDAEGSIVIENTFSDVKDFSDRGTVFVQIQNNWRVLKLIKDNY
jgi:hypothetical protein